MVIDHNIHLFELAVGRDSLHYARDRMRKIVEKYGLTHGILIGEELASKIPRDDG